jgi:uncharacterized protein (TIGR02246 family)
MRSKTRTIVFSAVASGLLVAGCEGSSVAAPAAERALAPQEGFAAQVAVVPPDAARGIHALLESREAAWNEGDGIAYGNHYTADADFVNPLGGIVTGSAAIGATHVFLFNPVNGPFRGSTASYVVRRMVALTGSLAIVDANETLTGFAGTPPGLVQHSPGVVKTRMRLLVGRENGSWMILAQQITAMQPGMPD